MPLYLRPQTVIKEHHFTTNSVQGEVTVNINLTVTLQVDQNGAITMSATPTVEPRVAKKEKSVPDYMFQIPDIEPVESGSLIEFGQDVNE